MHREADVIVVGAGVAGLHAAAELGLAGMSVILLDARSRIGGRIETVHADGWPAPIELGAEFIHGGNRIMDNFIERHRVPKHPVPEQHWWVERGVQRSMPEVWDRIDEVMKKIGRRYRGSFGEWLAANRNIVSRTDRKLAETFVRGFQGAPVNAMSAHTLFEATKEDEQQYRVVGGYGGLIRTLETRLPADRVQVTLGRTIDRIKWEPGQAMVHAGKQKWEAKAVVVAVPLGVLQARQGHVGRISFAPKLKEREQLWRQLTVGHAVRVILRMRADVWRRGVVPAHLRRGAGKAFGFLHSDERLFPVWWSEAPEPILVGWTGGPAAKKLAGKSPKTVFAHARRTLAKLLGCSEPALAGAILDWRTYDWSSDPFTRGAYSFSMAGFEDAPRRLAQPIARTLFFAGEATAEPLELGTVHGALASGHRVASEVRQALRKKR